MAFRHHNRDITERRDPIQEFADKIIAELKRGVKPWSVLGTPTNVLAHRLRSIDNGSP
jgi:antirestriction protein ArdC